ncbi:MAG: orotidine-5'-phosphate decarboxylase [Planctomycetota bacterium]
MRYFADRLFDSVLSKNSVVVVGLDPQPESFPPELGVSSLDKADCEGFARKILEFNAGIIESVAEFAAAVKPQIAFYEQFGVPGLNAFAQTCRIAADHNLPIIADVKRGDIGSTAAAYSRAFLGGPFSADAVTLNPYLGTDSLEPFISRCSEGYGAFILVRTSNKSATEFQDLQTSSGKLYEVVADRVAIWGRPYIGEHGWSSVGAVVGATWPGELSALRRKLPNVPFLVPGYGAQGGTAADVAAAFDATGLGAVVNSSRAILYAWKARGEDWRTAAANAAREMRDEFRFVLGRGK